MVGHSGAGVQLELCDEASGVGWTVGEQTTQGSALRADSPSGTGDAARQEADHPAVAGPSLIRVVAQGSAEHIGAGCRALPSIGGPVQNIGRRRLSPVAQAAPCFLQPDNDHNWRLTVANPLRDAAQSPINTPVDTPHLL